MKIKEIKVLIDGQEMTFSEEHILEVNFSDEKTELGKSVTNNKFKVNPKTINRALFVRKRKDERREQMRRLIQEAFFVMDANPKDYKRPFKTLIPEKTWDSKTVFELKGEAVKQGGCIGDWVRQALEWAQRISNGKGTAKAWKSVCNDSDINDWFRMVLWKNGSAKIIGGARRRNISVPMSFVSNLNYGDLDSLNGTVPLVILYK